MAKKIQIDPFFWIYSALLLYVLPINLFFGIAAASIIHELFHLLAIEAFGGQINQIHLKPSGLTIYAGSMPIHQSVICTAAGPVGSLLLISLSEYVPILAICGCIQGCFNLLPIYPLDGGRIVYTLLSAVPSWNVDKIFGIIQSVSVIILCYILTLLCQSMLISVFIILLLLGKRKSSCKDSFMAVQ